MIDGNEIQTKDDPDTCDHCWKKTRSLVGKMHGIPVKKCGSYVMQFEDNIFEKTKICINCASEDKETWWRKNFFNKNKYVELRILRLASSPVKCGGICNKVMTDFVQHKHITHGFSICKKCFESPSFSFN